MDAPKDWVVTEGELVCIGYYLKALHSLALESHVWKSNMVRFHGWSNKQRIKWIDYMEAQCIEGLPMAETLVSTALAIRMTK